VYYVNNVAGGATQLDIVNGAGAVQLFAANGSIVSRAIATSSTVTTLSFAPWAAPQYPAADDAWQASPASLFATRYVRIVGSGTAPLTFREIFVFDSTYTNVALNKAATSSGQLTGDVTAYSASMGCNGIIDMDNAASGDMSYSNSSVGAFWQVDLGAAYNVSTVVVWNATCPRQGP